ncbi:MAG: hypothetical protein IJ193_08155 [Bacilli bacterium]|nr:hypothetical protein [Bacilli bacterium]MBR1937092.1 hypothetical protein [Bacilli bacterium]
MINTKSENIKHEILENISKNNYDIKIDKVNPDNSVCITLIPNKYFIAINTSNRLTDELVDMLANEYGIFTIKNQNIIDNIRGTIYIEINHLMDMVGNHENN